MISDALRGLNEATLKENWGALPQLAQQYQQARDKLPELVQYLIDNELPTLGYLIRIIY